MFLCLSLLHPTPSFPVKQTWNLDSVNDGIRQLSSIAYDTLDFWGRNIFSFPPVGVARPVPEVHVTKLVHFKHITLKFESQMQDFTTALKVTINQIQLFYEKLK